MSVLLKTDYELCKSCKWSMYLNIAVDKKKYLACDYMSRNDGKAEYLKALRNVYLMGFVIAMRRG